MKNAPIKTRKGGCLFSLIKLAVLAVVVVAAVAYFASGFIGDYAIKTITSGTEITGGLGSLKINPLDQRATVGGFYITNPAKKYKKTNALAFKQAVVDLDLSLNDIVAKKLIVIDEISVEGLEANIETAQSSLTSTNLNEIADILQNKYGMNKGASSSQTAQSEPQSAEKKQSEPFKFIIKKLEIKSGTTSSSVLGNVAEVPIPDFTIENIGVAQGGMSAGEVAAYVLPRIASQATKQILNGSWKATIQTTGDAKGAVKGILNNLFNQDKK